MNPVINWLLVCVSRILCTSHCRLVYPAAQLARQTIFSLGYAFRYPHQLLRHTARSEQRFTAVLTLRASVELMKVIWHHV